MGKKLNTAQQKAVCHETGPMLVLAGPGSGKTTVLLCRISRLLERGLAKPQEILALTFSKAAAEEFKRSFRRFLRNIPQHLFPDSTEQIRLECGTDFSGGGKKKHPQK